MWVKASTGTEKTTVSLKPPEPRIDRCEFILKLAGCCAAKHGLKEKSRGKAYEARHSWEVIAFGILNALGMEAAAKLKGRVFLSQNGKMTIKKMEGIID